MTTTFTTFRRLAIGACASGFAGFTSLALFAPSAQAAGFAASFDPTNWILTNTNPDQSLNNSQFNCFVLNDVACVENIEPIAGAVDVVGSVSGQQGGNGANITRTTTWSTWPTLCSVPTMEISAASRVCSLPMATVSASGSPPPTTMETRGFFRSQAFRPHWSPTQS